MKKGIILTGLVLVAFMLFTGCQDQQDEEKSEIKIGVLGPFSGHAAHFGKDINHGLSLALEDIESDVKVVKEDTKCKPKEGVKAARSLIQVKDADYIVGPVCNEPLLSTVNLFNKEDVVSIYVGVPSEKIAHLGDSHYSFLPEVDLLMESVANDMEDKGYEEVGILTLQAPFNKENEEKFIEHFDGNITNREYGEFFDGDFKTQLMKIKENDPDAVLLSSIGSDLNVMLKQMKELGMDVPTYSLHTTETPQILEISNVSEGLIYPYPSEDKDIEASKRYNEKHVERFGKESTPYSASTYDAVNVLVEAIEECGDDKECVRDKIDSIENYEGANGPLTLNEHGAGEYEETELKVIENGSFKKLE